MKHEKKLSNPNFMSVTNDYIPLDREEKNIATKFKQAIKGLMRKPKSKEEPKMVEAILALYKVSPLGGM